MSDEDIQAVHDEIVGTYMRGYRMGTCEKLINAIPIPKKDRWEFEQWITDNSAPFIQVVVVKWTG